MFKTAITDMFGIRLPHPLRAMIGSASLLCARPSPRRGMGNITAGNYESEEEFRGASARPRSARINPLW